MTSGQQLLADLLGITNLATQSISNMNFIDQSPRDDRIVIVNKASHGNGEVLSNEKERAGMDSALTQAETARNSDHTSVSLEDAFDVNRSIEVKLHAQYLKEIDQNAFVSQTAQSESVISSGSSARLPTPEPSDFVKSGVFVSSAHQGKKPSSPGVEMKGTDSTEAEEFHLPKLQRLEESLSSGKVSATLMQGKVKSSMKQDTPEQEAKEMLVLQYPQGQKKNILQEKFKTRLQNSVPIKKTVVPKIINMKDSKDQSKETNKEHKHEPPKNSTSTAAPKIAADEAVSYAAVATSTAIAPFLQIQNALENTISNLVNTMSLAHEAEDRFKGKLQERRFDEIENKIMEILDKHVVKQGKLDERKDIQGKLVPRNDLRVGTIEHLAVEYEANTKQSSNEYDAELQMIPTRDIDIRKKTSSPLPIYPSTITGPVDPGVSHDRNQQIIHSQPTAIPRSYPVPTTYFDKSTSPFIDLVYSKNAKTQTSSSESSLLSEKSLLETPLPRSKIPIPFARYTPKNEDFKRKTKRQTDKRNELLRKILQEKKDSEFLDKENSAPKVSGRNIPAGKSRPLKEIKSKNNTKDAEIVDEPIKQATKEIIPTKEQHNILDQVAPIDRYLVYPLKNGDQNGRYPKASESKEESTKSRDESSTSLVKQSGRNAIDRTEARKMEGHHVTAGRILTEIQQCREKLDNNLQTLVRQRDQQRLYECIGQHESDELDDLRRIRLDVDKKIAEISAQMRKEIRTPPKQTGQTADVTEKKKKVSQRPNQRIGKVETKSKSKENAHSKLAKSRKNVEQKEKVKKKAMRKIESSIIGQPQAIPRPPQYDPDLLAAILGRRVYNAHRSSVRPPHIQFHSPEKISASTYVDLRQAHSRSHDTRNNTKSCVKDSHKSPSNQAKYYFQPSEPQFDDEARHFRFPSSGELVPVAKSLGRPRQDENLRLPIPFLDEKRSIDSASSGTVKQSNVAVIEIKAEASAQSKDRKKRAENFVIQNLPNVDIETSLEVSDVEKDRKELISNDTPQTMKHLRRPNRFVKSDQTEIGKDVTFAPPKHEDYEEFDNFIACTDIMGEEKEDENTNDEEPLEFEGNEIQHNVYNEPRFPPERPHCEVDTMPAKVQFQTSLEDRTQEWVEQELLARIVSEMNLPQDPTEVVAHDDQSESGESEEFSEPEDEEHDWIHEILGPGGLQLCIDAGIPINKDIIEGIFEDVVAEKVASLLGYPKQPKTPAKMSIEEEPPSEIPTKILTPQPTPVYTPVQSDASEIHTPISSSFTEESSREDMLLLEEETRVTTVHEREPVAQHEGDVIAPTPPQTPSISSGTAEPNANLETPVPSMKEDDVKPLRASNVPTPELSKADSSIRSLNDFLSTQTLENETLEEESPPQSPKETPKIVMPLPPPQTVQVVPKASSAQNSSFTISSSTAVGSSLFEGVSDGELLCPDFVIPGLYSEGEYPVSEGQDLQPLDDATGEDVGANFKELLQNMIGRKEGAADITTNGNDSATLKDTEELNEDTLEEVSISEGEILARDDPMVKLLNQIRSPPNVNSTLRGILPSNREKSEGEISSGEEIAIKQEYGPRMARDPKAKKIPGNRQRMFSAGEIPTSADNGSRSQRFSVGEVRNVSTDKVSSKTDESTRSRSDLQKDSILEVFRRQMKPQVEVNRNDGLRDNNERLEKDASESACSANDIDNSQLENEYLETVPVRPRIVLVQSGNFETTSTFNFTDSLNEQRLESFHEQDILDAIDEHQIDDEVISEERGSIESTFGKREIDNKQPTKITLTIPSVADEDTADELTLEGDDLYSNDNVSNISL